MAGSSYASKIFGSAAALLLFGVVAMAPIRVVAFDESADDLPEPGRESHLKRPNILQLGQLNLSAQIINSLVKKDSRSTDKTRRAQLAFVGEVLELYPGYEIYFLGLDAGRLFDTARLATQRTTDASRIHLISVSTEGSKTSGFVPYLAENGISEQALRSGKKILLIDAMSSGLNSHLISRQFSPAAVANLKTHSIANLNSHIPYSRAFLSMMFGSENRSGMLTLARSFKSKYLAMNEHFSAPAIDYVFHEGRWHPSSLSSAGPGMRFGTLNGTFYGDDVHFSKENEIADMFAMRNFWATEQATEFYSEARLAARLVKKFLLEGNAAALKSYISEGGQAGRLVRAISRDFISAMPALGMSLKTSATDLGLSDITSREERDLAKLTAEYPKWRELIEDPGLKSFRMIEAQDPREFLEFQSLDVPHNIRSIVIERLFSNPDKALEQIQLDFIRNTSQNDLWELANVSHTMLERGMIRQASALLDRYNGKALAYVLLDTFRGFTLRHAHPELILKAILKLDFDSLQMLSKGLARKGHGGFSLVADIPVVGETFNRSLEIPEWQNRSAFLRAELLKLKSPLEELIPTAEPMLNFKKSASPTRLSCETIFTSF